ncbi:MAG: hypothetical protein LBU19_11425 [Treponema sp.]|jgi:predicted transposase YdaD|nr:hypothetical protein [Treponema sp.]
MLIAEWNWDDALAVRYSEGMEKGMEEGREEIARNALAAGLPPGTISEITGLDITTINRLVGQ